MAANTSALFTLTPPTYGVQISTANTNRDGTGTIGTIWTVGANGGLLWSVRVQASVTTTAGVIRLFQRPGATWYLWKEILVTAVTPSTTVEAWSAEYVPVNPLALPSGALFGASTNNAETFTVFPNAGDY